MPEEKATPTKAAPAKTTAAKKEPVPTAKAMEDIANRYMVPITKDVIKVLAKELTPAKLNAFEEYMKQQAMGLYPTLAKQIEQGMPTRALIEPYRQVGKQVLGQNFEPDFIGDPKSAAALHGHVDEATGRPAPMPLHKWKEHLMNERSFGWEYTPAAHEAAQKVTSALNEGFMKPPAQGAPEGIQGAQR
jgi:hypothetical protein